MKSWSLFFFGNGRDDEYLEDIGDLVDFGMNLSSGDFSRLGFSCGSGLWRRTLIKRVIVVR